MAAAFLIFVVVTPLCMGKVVAFIASSPRSRPVEQIDPMVDKLVMKRLQGELHGTPARALPLRTGGINVCYPPTFFWVEWAVVNPFLNE